MSVNPNFNELKTAIDTQDIPKIRNLLTITVTKTRTDGTWAGSWTEEYQTQILRIRAFETDLELDEIIALHRLLPELLHHPTNIEIAMLRAIEAENLDFLQILLDLCASKSGFGQSLSGVNFTRIIQKALAVNNDLILSAIFRCPHEGVAYSTWLDHDAKSKMEAEIRKALKEDDGITRNTNWLIYHLQFLLSTHNHQISTSDLIKLIQAPSIQAKLTAESWKSHRLVNKIAHPDILAALLENPNIFSETLWLYSSVKNRSHKNWKQISIKDAHIFIALKQKIVGKMSDISSANPEDVESFYRPLLTYYLDSKTAATTEIQALLSIQALVDIKKDHLKKSFHYYGPKIYAGVDQYRELLNHVDLLKQFFDSAFQGMQIELEKIHLSCPRIEAIKAAYQDKTDPQEIWDILNRELPELKKDLIQLDQNLSSTQGFKQLFKNLLHLVASLITLGYHYYQRKRDLGQCFFKSASLEKQVQLQENQLKLMPSHPL